MNVLVLGMDLSPLSSIIIATGHAVIERTDAFDVEFLESNQVDFIVSYGFRHIIRKPILEHLVDRAINLHIAYLPWNRGADPNLWSFLESTPKGVTIHYIDEGIDTGDIIAQRLVDCDGEEETLATSYAKLNCAIIDLFSEVWPSIAYGNNLRKIQIGDSSTHRVREKERFMHLLTKGWDTPVNALKEKSLDMDVAPEPRRRIET